MLVKKSGFLASLFGVLVEVGETHGDRKRWSRTKGSPNRRPPEPVVSFPGTAV